MDADAMLRRYLEEDIDVEDEVLNDDGYVFYEIEPLSLDEEFDRAVREERHDIIDDLLEHGVTPCENLLVIASREGKLDVVTRLLASDAKTKINQAFLAAATNGHESVLTHLFMAGANINCSDDYGETALHKVRDAGVCQWLLDMGAVQKADNYGNFPIHDASSARNPALVKLLLDHGAEQTSGHSNSTPLHNACTRNDVGTVRILLEHGGQQISDSLTTPLHIATKHRNVEMVQLLLQYGGIQTLDRFGRTPLEVARNLRLHEVIHLLEPM